MVSSRTADDPEGGGQPEGGWQDYRPSVRLSIHDELRLLDEALVEARQRPKPPRAAFAVPPQLTNGQRVLRAPDGAGVHAERRPATMEPSAGNGAAHEPTPVLDLSTYVSSTWVSGEIHERSIAEGVLDAGQNGNRAEHGNGKDATGSFSDRKRLLAAIICILQDELTKK